MSLALIIFIKNAERGKVKTRLAQSIGPDAALGVYRRLLAHTRQVCGAVQAVRYLFYAEDVAADDEWSNSLFQKRLQCGADLGERMSNAFRHILGEGCKAAIIIGSDCPGLTASLITEAFGKLAEYDAVIGPATDGGYYLLGMKALHEAFFVNKAWSTSTVLKNTLEDMQRLRLSCHLLPVLTDVDEEQDLTAMHHLP